VWWAVVLVALLVARVRAEAAEEAAPGEMQLEVIRAAEVTPIPRGQPLQAKRTLGVRNFESTAKPDVGLEFQRAVGQSPLFKSDDAILDYVRRAYGRR
jgi:hypothetical protein